LSSPARALRILLRLRTRAYIHVSPLEAMLQAPGGRRRIWSGRPYAAEGRTPGSGDRRTLDEMLVESAG